MADQITGRIRYANGIPAANVRIRVFDSDLGGVDDDLTIAEALSAADGTFLVRYDSARAIDLKTIDVNLGVWRVQKQIADPFDQYLPYLKLTYQSFGRERIQTVRIDEAVPMDIRLADAPPAKPGFLPSVHGFKFGNYFPGTPLPFSIPELPNTLNIPAFYGLCGGMAAAAADYYYAGKPIPPVREAPNKRTVLYNYLMRRQIDSFSPMGEPIVRFVKWMKLDPDVPFGSGHRAADEISQLKAMFAAGMPAHPIGLVFASPGDALWENHQVLAYGYREPAPNLIEIMIYDPNYQENDQVVIQAERMILRGQGNVGPAGSYTTVRCKRVARVADLMGRPKNEERPMRGMFLMPYVPVEIG
jgi:hypothetical protein